jgi:hypothetical protein
MSIGPSQTMMIPLKLLSRNDNYDINLLKPCHSCSFMDETLDHLGLTVCQTIHLAYYILD